METVKVALIKDMWNNRIMESFIFDSSIEDKKILKYLNNIIKNDYQNGKYSSSVNERFVFDKV